LNQGAKQRIVGTVVLLALALIFLPIIFDGNGNYQVPVSSRIPDAPIISMLPEPIQSRPVIVGEMATALPEPAAELAVETKAVETKVVETKVVETKTLKTKAAENTQAEIDAAVAQVNAVDAAAAEVEISESQAIFSREIAQLSEAGLPQGWSVRLGSFSDAENASMLMDRLLQAGYKAYTRALPSNQGSLTAVFVGPWLDRGQVNEYQQKLQQEFNLAGLVVRYELESL
jgi:DedD protein